MTQERRNTTGNKRSSGQTVRRRSGTNNRNVNVQRRSSSGRNKSGSPAAVRARRRRRNERLRFLLPVILLSLVAVCLAGTLLLYRLGQNKAPQVNVDLELLDSPYAVLIDRDSGDVLASKRGNEQMYPASLTKIMTVLTALEQLKDVNQTVTLSYDYFQELYDQDASRAGFDPGEEARIIDLMYGAILPSGAECCRELALQAAGSEQDFAVLMNAKAEKLGLSNTHFCNSTGLHDPEQYSTAEDIAKLLRDALKNETFYQIITSKYYSVPPSNVHPDGFTFYGTMFKGMEDPTVNGGQILGGKTGYTGEAGHCLASFAEVNGRDYILVTGGVAAEPRTAQYHIDDAFRTYNQIADDN